MSSGGISRHFTFRLPKSLLNVITFISVLSPALRIANVVVHSLNTLNHMKRIKIEDLENNILQNEKILEELQHGTDRSIAIVGATIIETQLEKLLSVHLVDNNKLKKKALDYNGFLGTFSAKINACFLLGLISKNLYNDIDRIRDIRNTFAHNLIDCNFNNHYIKSEVHKLKLLQEAFTSDWEKQSVPMMFLMEISLIYVALIKKIVRNKPISELPYEINDLGFEDIDYEYLEK